MINPLTLQHSANLFSSSHCVQEEVASSLSSSVVFYRASLQPVLVDFVTNEVTQIGFSILRLFKVSDLTAERSSCVAVMTQWLQKENFVAVSWNESLR